MHTFAIQSFSTAFKASLTRVSRALPKSSRCLTWAHDEAGNEYAAIGPHEGAFLLGGERGAVTLWSLRSGGEQPLGTWAPEDLCAATVVSLIAGVWAAEVAMEDAFRWINAARKVARRGHDLAA